MPADVTVVIPAYGTRDGALARAVESTVREPNVQIMVVDDATPDHSVAALCEEFTRARYVRREANGGVAAAQSTGVAAVETEWVCFLHSDDEFVTERIGQQLPLAGGPGTVVGGACRFDDVTSPDPMAGATVDDLLFHRFGVHISPYLFPTECLRREPFDEHLRTWEDWDLLLRLEIAGTTFVDAGGIVSRVRADATERLSTSDVNGPALAYLYEKHQDLLTTRELRARWEFKIGRTMLGGDDRRAARTWMARSLLHEPWHPRRVRSLVSTFAPGRRDDEA